MHDDVQTSQNAKYKTNKNFHQAELEYEIRLRTEIFIKK